MFITSSTPEPWPDLSALGGNKRPGLQTIVFDQTNRQSIFVGIVAEGPMRTRTVWRSEIFGWRDIPWP